LRLVHTGHDQHPSIFAAGKFLAEQLSQPDLVHVLVLADGILINGSELTSGFNAHLPGSVSLSGGLAADNAAFTETVVCTAEGAASKQIIALGLYGSNLEVACGTGGGWEPFGPERVVTRSDDNELFEMDHRSALELYRLYLGEFATGLPATGLSFPLEIRIPAKPPLVRTVQAINHESGSLIFAGDVPEGAIARLMKTNLDHLLDGAAQATDLAAQQLSGSADLALIISCLGRKMVLKQRCEEELEEVYQRLQIPAPLTGFYSNGEMAPNIDYKYCNFHNQTLTITLLREASD